MKRFASALTAILLLATSLFAQGRREDAPAAAPIDYTTARFSRVLDAVRINEPIHLDGKLDEPAWQRAKPATDFTQREPTAGAPATEQSEGRVLYDEDNLYVGVTCFVNDPKNIVVNELREDFSGMEGDEFLLFFDSLHDQRSGFGFAVNPVGARRDWQSSNDGDQISVDWDGVWDVRVSRSREAWYIEYQIPFKTLRFTSSETQEWGFNVGRRSRKQNEDSFWAPLPRRYRTVSRASMAGTLRGLEGIRQGRNLKVKPYLTTGLLQTRPADTLESDVDYDGGVDLKYGLTQSLTLDLTYRTDFSQVEADQQQVNLTRFNVFFPEKREFFLENTGIFNFGAGGFRGGGPGGGGGGGGGGGNNLIPFFSRRIGLSSSGTPIPIVGGARLSGKTGTYDLGMLTMKTESFAGTPSNMFSVGRARKNLRNQSWVGMLVTNRDSTAPGNYNRVYGADASFRFFEKLDVLSYVLRSDTPGRSGRNQARLFDIGWRDNDYSITGQYDEVQPNFNPEMGFVRRGDMKHYTVDLSWRPRLTANPYIRNFNLSTSPDYYADGDGRVETRTQDVNLGVFFHNSSSINFNVVNNFERLTEPFGIRTDLSIPVGDYNYRRSSMFFNLDRSRKISGGGNFSWGRFWNGDQTSYGGSLDLKPSYRFSVDLNANRNRVTLPNGAFTTILVGSRFAYAFSSKMFLNAFLQYNADTHQFSSNIRFNLIHHALSDLFIVYNDRRDTISGRLLERALVVKVTNLFIF